MSPKDSLLLWFQRNKRDLPFRKNKTAYSVWVSEVMLQQTRVQAMIPLYNSFLEKFPTVEALAKAELEDVIAAWKGLGYYSRAKNLWKGAQVIVRDFNGAFPRDLSLALSVPGIGPYTARAVLSIGLGEPFAVLDGNVKRVLSRFSLYETNVLTPQADKELQAIADQFLNQKEPGLHNEAVMELGATICLPTTPQCLLCPIQKDCKALAKGRVQDLPIRSKEKNKVQIELFFLVLKNANSEIFLTRTKQRKFFKTVWALPHFLQRKGEEKPTAGDLPFFEANLLQAFSFSEPVGGVSHSITHHAIKAFILFADVNVEEFSSRFYPNLLSQLPKDWEASWFPKEALAAKFPSSLTEKLQRFFV